MSRRNTPQDDWLTLVEVNAPFLAEPVLRSRIGEHPIKTDTAKRNRILEHTTAQHDPHGKILAEADPTAFARWLLEDQLGYKVSGAKATLDPSPAQLVTFTTQGRQITQAPSMVIHDPGDTDRPRLLICADPGGVLPKDLDAYEPEARHKAGGWIASPVHRATTLARRLNCRLALITNGRLITVVGIHDNVVGHATWDTMLFRPEPRHLDSLLTVLDPNRLFGAPSGQLESMLNESLDKQQDVTKTLGSNVRKAAELLVAEMSRANQRANGHLFDGVPEAKVYEAAVTVIMRTVFLLTAEENGLLPVDNELYRSHYAASTLYNRLEGDLRAGSATAQRRAYAWHRLLGLFRAVHGGVATESLTVNAYGGSLFDPERFPFLEGRTSVGEELDTDLVSDLVLHAILRAITVVDGKTVSFRALDVEQIGHVYESLLDHSTVTADGPVLGVVGKDGLEPEISLDELEARLEQSPAKFASWFEGKTNGAKKAKWVRERLQLDLDPAVARGLLPACGGDQALYDRVHPLANLLRTDLRGLPMVILDGDLYVTETTTKSDTGTAYTTKELADEIAEHALAPLVYSPGPQDTADDSQWQPRSSAEILGLKVCDPAIGSAAIAVAAVRYLAGKLVGARRREGMITDDQLTAGAGDSTQLEVHVQARRDVVAHCIYGVDMDPMAVEMAKMSLWLVTMAKDRPFTFLDHAIKCGNSLLGVTDLRQLEKLHLDPPRGGQSIAMLGLDWVKVPADYERTVRDIVGRASLLREQLRSSDTADARDAAAKAKLHAEVEQLTGRLRTVADALVAACLSTAHLTSDRRDHRLNRLRGAIGDLDHQDVGVLSRLALSWREEHNPRKHAPRRFFHWPLEFPEAFDGGGRFDALVGNPPFLGSQKISDPYGDDVFAHLKVYVARSTTAGDLVGFFFVRGLDLSDGFGFIATNSVAQGKTHDMAMKPVAEARTITRAWTTRKWPNTKPAVHVAMVWVRAGNWQSPALLDGIPYAAITSDLYPQMLATGDPLPLPSHAGSANQGFIPVGKNFHISEETAKTWILSEPRNAEVIRPFAAGEINDDPAQQPKRWTIFFGTRSKSEAATYPLPFAHVEEHVQRERANTKRKSTQERWWRYGEARPELLRRLAGRSHVIAVVRTSTYAVPIRLDASIVLGDSNVVFPFDDWGTYGALTSTLHRVWADRYGSTMKRDLRYTHTSIFDPFPFPKALNSVAGVMQDLHTWRADRMVEAGKGLTAFYGCYHNAEDLRPVTQELRRRHRQLDHALATAYGWDDLDLRHNFYDTRYGTFYTMSHDARYEVLDRLLLLNHTQYGEQTRG